MRIFIVSYFVRFIPWVLSPFTWIFVRCNPAFYSLQGIRSKMTQLLEPEVEHMRMSSQEANKDRTPPTMLEWMSTNGRNKFETDLDALVNRSILLTFAGSFTVVHGLNFLLNDICKYPQFTEELRQEAELGLSESGQWDRYALDKMTKIESFMTESQRMNPGLLRMSAGGGTMFLRSYADVV